MKKIETLWKQALKIVINATFPLILKVETDLAQCLLIFLLVFTFLMTSYLKGEKRNTVRIIATMEIKKISKIVWQFAPR